jgi:palmitoyl transferase
MPVPLIFPVGSIESGRWSLDVAYVPGGKGNGNVMFFTNKWRFGADK